MAKITPPLSLTIDRGASKRRKAKLQSHLAANVCGARTPLHVSVKEHVVIRSIGCHRLRTGPVSRDRPPGGLGATARRNPAPLMAAHTREGPFRSPTSQGVTTRVTANSSPKWGCRTAMAHPEVLAPPDRASHRG
jgi:hypothetical protein